MALTSSEIWHLLLALVLLLVAAHGIGYLFSLIGQPPVIGEILGGLLLGPTLFGALLPGLQEQVFPDSGSTASVLGAVYQLGLFLLMFAAGAELRAVFHRGERRTATLITLTGMLLPFVAGLAVVKLVDVEGLQGPAGSDGSFLLVFAIAIAVTSIPVISRIMLDLGILETAFARIVLTAAVIEDVVLYVVLAVALGLAQHEQGGDFGLAALVGLDPASGASLAYHVVATLVFFGLLLWAGPRLLRRSLQSRYNLLNRRSPIAFQLAGMLALTGACLFLGITPLFGALVAGLVLGISGADDGEARESIKSFAFAFFVPVYFAIVGLRLDLIHSFSPLLFAAFLAFACSAKSLSVYAGARLAGHGRFGSRNLAVAMNARGGPGIVLASVAFDAGIIDEQFYAMLVLLAILTSLLAGSWLERVVRAGKPLLGFTPVATPRFENAGDVTGLEPGLQLGRRLHVRDPGGAA
jgi:Kef-type K+ transport system membrane component KefB